jgi:transglutaminase superfamily protein
MYLLLLSFWELMRVDYFLSRGDLPRIYSYVATGGSRRRKPNKEIDICTAVETACVWFWKEVSCLHRSAVTARLLKQSGVGAQMVIGAQSLPFKAHAWVEIGGRIVNDKPYISDVYQELDRF